MASSPNDVPHSISAEQQLLGAILLSPGVLDSVENILTPADFFESIHAYLYGELIKARDEGRQISLNLFKELLIPEVRGALISGLTVSEYVARMAAEAATTIYAQDFARLIV